ncbi:hypothetical protein X797_004811 [Metarhizium robertsii]|uniref:Uncharacterized protein n=1 Tax=Metarhizium robertsii TaxID=568076 RepID=A0A0A1UXE0_9HYPO|nr:hypothetical protein X797_004811 [Metarhizium robertsii]
MDGPTEATFGAAIKQLALNEDARLGQANPSSSAFRETSINRKDRQIKLHSFRFNLDDLEALSLKAIPEFGVAAMLFRDDHLLAEYHIPSTLRSALDELDIKTFVGDALTPSRNAPENLCVAGNLSYGGRQTGL